MNIPKKTNLRTSNWRLIAAARHYGLPATHAGYRETVARALARMAEIERKDVEIEVPDEIQAPKYVEIRRKATAEAMDKLVYLPNGTSYDTPHIGTDMINAALTMAAVGTLEYTQEENRDLKKDEAMLTNLLAQALNAIESEPTPEGKRFIIAHIRKVLGMGEKQ